MLAVALGDFLTGAGMLSSKSHLTTGELALHFRVAVWQVRRAVDALAAPILRAGLYRLVPRSLLADVETELRRRHYLREADGQPSTAVEGGAP
jgi:hypothetical protein